jgi:hypothetical protein
MRVCTHVGAVFVYGGTMMTTSPLRFAATDGAVCMCMRMHGLLLYTALLFQLPEQRELEPNRAQLCFRQTLDQPVDQPDHTTAEKANAIVVERQQQQLVALLFCDAKGLPVFVRRQRARGFCPGLTSDLSSRQLPASPYACMQQASKKRASD